MENKESFNYTYSSIHKEEIEKIRNKYIQNQETDLDELRKLDQKVTNSATFCSILVGIAGVLVFGTGLSLVLSFGKMIFGIIVSFFGFASEIPFLHTAHKTFSLQFGSILV